MSAEFIFRILGMIVFATLGALWGNDFGEGNTELMETTAVTGSTSGGRKNKDRGGILSKESEDAPAMADMVVGEARPVPVASNLSRAPGMMAATPDGPMMGGGGGPEAPRSSPHPGASMPGPALPAGPPLNEPTKV